MVNDNKIILTWSTAICSNNAPNHTNVTGK